MAKSKESPYDAAHYTYTVAWSAEDEAFVARVAEFPSLAAHGDTMEKALKEIRFVVESIIEDLAKSNEPIPEPLSQRQFSGKINLRMPKELHRKLATEAAQQGVSLNDWMNHKLEK